MRQSTYPLIRHCALALVLLLTILFSSTAGERQNSSSILRHGTLPITVSGQVTNEAGEALVGVTVQVRGSQTGTTTDNGGYYQLTADDTDTLVFSYIGYISQSIAIGGQTQVDVTLHNTTSELDQVIVVGYGTQKKVNLTGAVDVIEAGELKDRAVSTLPEALQGVSPNLNITGGLASYEPGGRMAMNIRGVGSLTGVTPPYILVDGMPIDDISSINPYNIESISVLKDAAASAIYGARGAYGVILITTKKGKQGERITVNYANSFSLSSPIGLPHTARADRYMLAHNQALANAGQPPQFSEEDIQRVKDYMAGKIKNETWVIDEGTDFARYMGNGWWDIGGNGNNDFLHDVFYDKNVLRQKHDASVSGGGKNTAYFLSAGYLDQPGELRYGNMFYKRYNVAANIEAQPIQWLTVSLKTKYTDEKKNTFNRWIYYSYEDIYHNMFRMAPFRPVHLPNGEFSDFSMVNNLRDGGNITYYGSRYLLSLQTAIEPIKDWVTKLSYHYSTYHNRTTATEKTVYGTLPKDPPEQYVIATDIDKYSTSFDNTSYNMINVVTSYHRSLGRHYLQLMAGYEQELSQTYGLSGQKDNMITPGVPSISTSVGEYYLDDWKSHWATQSFFGRLNYNYQEKFLLELNARYDGSSRFAPDSRWGLFPSLSVGYNLSKEDFWDKIRPVFNSFKLRGSWGSLGNQNVPNYLYLPRLGIGTNSLWIMGNSRPNYAMTPGLISADLTWETATTINIGLDVSALNHRLTATFDLYRRMTSDMFGPAEALPITLGTNVPQTNNAELETRGFELTVGWQDQIGTLSYHLQLNVSDNVSTVKQYNNPTKTTSTWYEGQRLGDVWGLTTAGIYPSDKAAAEGPDQSLFFPVWRAGDIHYKDLDGDNIITRGKGTVGDPGDYRVICNYLPRYNFGFTAGLQWKGFDFNMFWQGTAKRQYPFDGAMDMTYFGFKGEQWWDMNMWEYKNEYSTIDYWRPADETNAFGPNTDAFYPKPYLSIEDYKNRQVQSRYVENAAYVRLKHLTLGYTLPTALTRKVSIHMVRVHVSFENLLTFTPLTGMFDPEALVYNWAGTGKMHPLRTSQAIGLNITF